MRCGRFVLKSGQGGFETEHQQTRSVFNTLTVGPDRFYLSISEYDSDIYVVDVEY